MERTIVPLQRCPTKRSGVASLADRHEKAWWLWMTQHINLGVFKSSPFSFSVPSIPHMCVSALKVRKMGVVQILADHRRKQQAYKKKVESRLHGGKAGDLISKRFDFLLVVQ